jgi:hypothetical protein
MISAVSLWTTLAAGMLLHPVHATLTEVEWNSKTERLEVGLRLDRLDEQRIAKRLGVKVDDEGGGKDVGHWRAAFLRDHLWFDPQADGASADGASADGASARDRDESDNSDTPQDWSGLPIRWVGRQSDGGYVWWFFEVIAEDGQPPSAVRTRLLFDHQPDYEHRIVVLNRSAAVDGKRRSVVLTKQQPQAPLAFR